jgi:nicotinate-nucleotide adenylyltransferase
LPASESDVDYIYLHARLIGICELYDRNRVISMNIGVFGGTFDPVHKGHLALAAAARDACRLSRIYFVAANLPPHRASHPVASYVHRYAMTALAVQSEPSFVASLLEAPREFLLHDRQSTRTALSSSPNYTIDTIRRLKQTIRMRDRVFFLVGIDAFKDIAGWREAENLFSECEFIVASRPGYSLADIASALPEKLRPREAASKPFAKQPARGALMLPGVRLYLLDNVRQNISATKIRQTVRARHSIHRFVPQSVEEYIRKQGLYR